MPASHACDRRKRPQAAVSSHLVSVFTARCARTRWTDAIRCYRTCASQSRCEVFLLGLAWARPAGKCLRDLAGTLDEQLHDRTKGTIFQRHDPHRVLVDGKFDWQHFERISLAVRPYDGVGKYRYELAVSSKTIAQGN